MTLSIFPSNLPGLTWDVKKTPLDSTRILTSRSGKEYRAPNWSFGKYKWQVTYSVLRQNRFGLTELQQLLGFCRAQQGQFQSFLYSDPTDNAIIGQTLAIGDGNTVIFPFVRAFGGYVEPNLVLNTLSNLYVNGTIVPTNQYATYQNGDYGIDSVKFNAAPGVGQIVSADFSWYFPVRFLQDDPEFNNLAYQFWELQKLEFQSVK